MSDLASLHRAQTALAKEITANPDRKWTRTLLARYIAFLSRHGPKFTIDPVETWRPGSIELTEAILRSVGMEHVDDG